MSNDSRLIRPNTEPLYEYTTKTHLSLPTIALCPHGIACLLQHYPDPEFVNTLVTISTHGARIGYQGPKACIMQPNHKSATLHVGIIEANIQSELRKGRIKQLPHLPSHYFCSPLGLVPKNVNGVQADWRTIFNLSSPESSSVNDGIPKEFGAISYESLAVAINLIAEAGPGAMLMKRDLKSAFRHVPVSPLDHWLLIFEWDGKFYVDMFLPFGLRTAPRIFNLFALLSSANSAPLAM